MPEYRIEWSIELDANNAVAAAQQARTIQLDTDSTATVFNVWDNATGEESLIDLDALSDMEDMRRNNVPVEERLGYERHYNPVIDREG
jgi:hypothetical protein